MKPANTGLSQRTIELIDNNLLWDNHACMPLRPGDTRFLNELEQFREAGVNIVSLNAGFDAVAWDNTLLVLANFRKWIKQHDDRYLLVNTVADIELAKQSGKLGITFDLEGATTLNGRLEMIELYYDLGVRWMLLAYNRSNEVGGGCQDEDRGLTNFGREVLREMSRVGMVICCSHTGSRTVMEVMEYADKPVIFSHSNPAALWTHKRNISDTAIQACAATGGVVGINGVGIFLGDNDASIDSIVRHIDHVVELVGADHVGIALDYTFDQEEVADFVRDNPLIFPPEEGYADGLAMLAPSAIPAIVGSLIDLGYADEAIKKIMGGNHLRIAQQVWR